MNTPSLKNIRLCRNINQFINDINRSVYGLFCKSLHKPRYTKRHIKFQKSILIITAVFTPILQAADTHTPGLFDFHVHLRDGEKSLQAYEEQLQEGHLQVSGIGAMWFGGSNQALAGQTEKIQSGNDGIIALAAKYPKVMPIGTVHPYDGQAALLELERIVAKGVKVLKIHPHTQKFDPDDSRVLTLVQRAGELGVIILMDNANILPGDSEKLFNLALKAPKTKFIFAHLGGLNFRFWNILKPVRTAEGLFGENIYFDISAMVEVVAGSPLEEEYIWTIRNVGVDHVLLGSDYPQYSLEQNLVALEKLALTEEEKAKIRYQNAEALFSPQ